MTPATVSEKDIKKYDVSSLIFPKFNDIKVSTKTFIVMTNLTLNITELFEYLPITEYYVVPKRRGRKKKNENKTQHIHPGRWSNPKGSDLRCRLGGSQKVRRKNYI